MSILLNSDTEYDKKDWIVIEDPTTKKLEDLEKIINEMKITIESLHKENETMKTELAELNKKISTSVYEKTKSLWNSNKFTDADLLKIDYIRSRNTCIRTKSTAKFMPEIS